MLTLKNTNLNTIDRTFIFGMNWTDRQTDRCTAGVACFEAACFDLGRLDHLDRSVVGACEVNSHIMPTQRRPTYGQQHARTHARTR